MSTKRFSAWLAAFVVVAVVVATSAAAAGGKKPIRIETHGVLTGPASAAGNFVMTGAVSDSGTFVDAFSFDGDTIHVLKTLSGSKGTFTIKAKGTVVMTSPTTATFTGGRWRIVSGTGAYADLRGGGRPGAVGSVDFAAGTVDVTHEGKARCVSIPAIRRGA